MKYSLTLKLPAAIAAALFFYPLLSEAGGPESPVLTLSIQEIGKRASENSSLLKAQSQDLESARLEAEASGTLPNPSIAVQWGSLSSGGVSGRTVEATLTQTIPFPGKLGAQTRVKELDTKLMQASAEQAKLLIQHEASLRALQWVTLDEKEKHFQERERRFRLMRDFLSNRPIVSPAAKAESYLIEGQIESLEKQFVELEAEKTAIERQLRYLLQVSNAVKPQASWIEPQSLPRKQTAVAGLAQSPELLRKQLEISQAQEAVERERRRILPDVTLGVGYRNEAVQPANNFYYGSVALSIPLFDRGQYSVPASRAKLEAERAREGALRTKVTQDLEAAWIRLEAAQALAKKFHIARIAEIDRRFSEVDRGFRKGQVSTSVLLQTDAQLHDTVNAIYDAQLNLGQRLSELNLLTGQSLSWK